jgi:hypothetical protein
MGTSSAFIWATVYYAIQENECILPRYGQHLYKNRLLRFIDDVFGIWIFDRDRNHTTETPWMNFCFCRDLQSFGLLRWDIETPSTRKTFLDLNIEIIGKRMRTSTFQKEMNLYLYLPGSSAHTTSMIKGTIYGQMLSYYQHNNQFEDYIKFSCLLYQRLLVCGHQQSKIRPMFLEVHTNIITRSRTLPTTTPIQTDSKQAIYLHFEYHPEDVPRNVIRALYYKHQGDTKKILELAPPIVAYSGPSNLGKICSQARLHEAPGQDAVTHLSEYTTRQGPPRPTGKRFLPVVHQWQ